MAKNAKPQLIKLPRIQKELTQCQMCGYCIEVCEAHRQTPWESVTARGKIYYLNQLDKAGFGAMDKVLKRKATLSPEFVDAMYKCTGCGNCEAVCHAKIELVALWEKIRKWMADEGVAPLPVHRKLEKSIIANGNPYGEPKSKRDAWWPEEVPRTTPPQAIFFAGCTGSYRMQNIPKAAVTILDRAGVTVNCLGENEVCCTSPLLRTGINMQTLEASKEVVTKADALGAKDMVMSCSGCYKTVSSNYVQYYGKPGQNVYHITQYVDKLINARKLPLNNEFNAKVTYHDPCHLGRHSKVYEEPRNILKKIKGIEFVEMEKNRENSRCCGAGGGYKSAFNNFAVNIAAERIRDAEAVGAEVIATACPFCVLNLKHGAKQIGSKVKVMDITEILLQVTAPKVEEPKVEEPVKEAPKEEPAPAVEAAPAAEAAPAEAVAEVPKAGEVPAAEAAAVDAAASAEEAPKAEEEPAKEKMSIDDTYAYADNLNKKQVENGVYDEKRAAAFDGMLQDVKNSDASDEEKAIQMSQIIGGMIGAASAGAAVGAAAAASSEEEAPAEEAPAEEPIEEEAVEEAGEDYDIDEDEWALTPEGIVRRAAWNKGLRCRRNYGPLAIPVAFVKWKVAVYIDASEESKRDRDALEKDGWIVMNYNSADVTDGQDQAVEIRDAVKSQTRLMKKKKKKKKA
ncbi:MAG: (Fe-S)-binding protein [Candidatus Methanomethylophilaceae archaeon]|nr:(Fe-S)-binding protein [Candidatus Methanomethylophilaceae archaeon]